MRNNAIIFIAAVFGVAALAAVVAGGWFLWRSTPRDGFTQQPATPAPPSPNTISDFAKESAALIPPDPNAPAPPTETPAADPTPRDSDPAAPRGGTPRAGLRPADPGVRGDPSDPASTRRLPPANGEARGPRPGRPGPQGPAGAARNRPPAPRRPPPPPAAN